MTNNKTELTNIERSVQIEKAFFCADALQDHDVWDIYEAAQDAHLDLGILISSGTYSILKNTAVDHNKESQQIRELIIALHDEWTEQVEAMDDANMDKFETLADELEAIFNTVYTRVTQEQKDYFNERGLQYGIIE